MSEKGSTQNDLHLAKIQIPIHSNADLYILCPEQILYSFSTFVCVYKCDFYYESRILTQVKYQRIARNWPSTCLE